MEFFKKMGAKVELGCFVVILVGVLLPFISYPSKDISILTYNPTMFIGFMALLLSLSGGSIVAIEAFGRHLFEKIDNKIILNIFNYGPIIIGENILVGTLTLGLVLSSDTLATMGTGAWLVIIGSSVLVFLAFYRKFIYKDLIDGREVEKKEEIKPVMQPVANKEVVTVSQEVPVVPLKEEVQTPAPVIETPVVPVIETPAPTPVVNEPVVQNANVIVPPTNPENK